MVKKRSSFARHGPYLGIVAVVAVVAIVFLILSFVGVSPVGEAIKIKKVSTAVTPPVVAWDYCTLMGQLLEKETNTYWINGISYSITLDFLLYQSYAGGIHWLLF